MLIIASEQSAPLCTPEPIPTDGQSQWGKCPNGDGRSRARVGLLPCPLCGAHDVPDGPFPFTVGVWEELERNDRHCTLHDTLWNYCPHDDCEPVSGAIVELREVVGPSHHADECDESYDHAYTGERFAQFCHPDAAPDCWHTPTGTVTRIDPIPCERPVACYLCMGLCVVGNGHEAEWVPTSVWTADDALSEQLREHAMT